MQMIKKVELPLGEHGEMLLEKLAGLYEISEPDAIAPVWKV